MVWYGMVWYAMVLYGKRERGEPLPRVMWVYTVLSPLLRELNVPALGMWVYAVLSPLLRELNVPALGMWVYTVLSPLLWELNVPALGMWVYTVLRALLRELNVPALHSSGSPLSEVEHPSSPLIRVPNQTLSNIRPVESLALYLYETILVYCMPTYLESLWTKCVS